MIRSTSSASSNGRPSERRGIGSTRTRKSSSWLITYADLMTILVCFFVLIVSFSIQDQVKLEVVAGSMRDAFGVAEERRYAGDVKMIGTPDQLQPGNVRPALNPTASAITDTLTARPAAGSTGHDGAYEARADEDARFEAVRDQIERAILTHPLLKDQSEAVTIAVLPEGLQIVMVDTSGAPMFASGEATPSARARSLIGEIAPILSVLPNMVTIEGHADASGQGRYSAFELTAARANAAREILQAEGLREDRIAGVIGRGVARPLYPDDPYAAGNRRIEILLERAAPLLPPDRSL